MTRLSLPIVLLVALLPAVSALAQTVAPAPSSSPQAIQTLQQALTAAGGAQAIGSIQDFSATGTITYFWAGEQVQGSATVLARGFDQFRLDAVIPDGTRTYAVSHGTGSLKNTDGTVTAIPYHNTINVGILTFPYLGIAARLNDSSTAIADDGLAATDGAVSLHKVETQRQVSTQDDPQGDISKLTVTDYYIDPTANLVMKVIDMTHPDETMTRSYPHEIDFANYTAVKGVNVPMLITEKVDGNATWQLQLTSVSFNVGLTDANFVLQ